MSRVWESLFALETETFFEKDTHFLVDSLFSNKEPWSTSADNKPGESEWIEEKGGKTHTCLSVLLSHICESFVRGDRVREEQKMWRVSDTPSEEEKPNHVLT